MNQITNKVKEQRSADATFNVAYYLSTILNQPLREFRVITQIERAVYVEYQTYTAPDPDIILVLNEREITECIARFQRCRLAGSPGSQWYQACQEQAILVSDLLGQLSDAEAAFIDLWMKYVMTFGLQQEGNNGKLRGPSAYLGSAQHERVGKGADRPHDSIDVYEHRSIHSGTKDANGPYTSGTENIKHNVLTTTTGIREIGFMDVFARRGR